MSKYRITVKHTYHLLEVITVEADHILAASLMALEESDPHSEHPEHDQTDIHSIQEID